MKNVKNKETSFMFQELITAWIYAALMGVAYFATHSWLVTGITALVGAIILYAPIFRIWLRRVLALIAIFVFGWMIIANANAPKNEPNEVSLGDNHQIVIEGDTNIDDYVDSHTDDTQSKESLQNNNNNGSNYNYYTDGYRTQASKQGQTQKPSYSNLDNKNKPNGQSAVKGNEKDSFGEGQSNEEVKKQQEEKAKEEGLEKSKEDKETGIETWKKPEDNKKDDNKEEDKKPTTENKPDLKTDENTEIKDVNPNNTETDVNKLPEIKPSDKVNDISDDELANLVNQNKPSENETSKKDETTNSVDNNTESKPSENTTVQKDENTVTPETKPEVKPEEKPVETQKEETVTNKEENETNCNVDTQIENEKKEENKGDQKKPAPEKNENSNVSNQTEVSYKPVSVTALDGSTAVAGDTVQFKLDGDVAMVDGGVNENGYVSVKTNPDEATVITITAIGKDGSTASASVTVNVVPNQ